jgi:glycosyltransferase involved in cell wall biosynthesis
VKPLRFGLILDQPLEVGGGFQQPLNDLLWLCQWAAESGNEVVVLSPHRQSLMLLAGLGIKAELLKPRIRDHLFLFLKYCGPFDLLQVVLRMMAPFEKSLLRHGIDVVYFTSTSKWHLLLYRLPFIITIFDGCHRDAVEFEEVRAFGDFERREVLFRSAATKAVLVVTNANELIDTLCYRYAMDRNRAVCIPFSPSTYVSTAGDTTGDAAVLRKYGLAPGYLFYPAQFWPHKNHGTLLAALALLREQGLKKRLVLCGSDRGMRNKVDALIAYYDLVDQVSIIGFVDSSELGPLYRGATALVMPSYFGPTNIPPLEAWAVGTPVIYPEAFKGQVGDAAMLFDYDNPASLADAIIRIDLDEVRTQLSLAGTNRLNYFANRTDEGHRQFAIHIERIKYRLSSIKH